MFSAKSGAWIQPLICLIISLAFLVEVDGEAAPMVLLESGVAKGAVCLDGSPPAYHFSAGSGSGANSWMIYIEGGAWCSTVKECSDRKSTNIGSSKLMGPMSFSGPLGGVEKYNPDFFNWNRIKFRYCDGSSFTGDVEEVDKETNIYYRGARIFSALMEELLAKGMDKAENALLGGCSAGGLAAILNCDRFSDLLPKTARVKCLSDAGFFLHRKDISGKDSIQQMYANVVKLHNSAQNLPASCTAKYPAEQCFFPQYVAETMKTPLFILNAAYDSWQVRNVLVPSPADTKKEWGNCRQDITKCSPAQIEVLQAYREDFLKALPADKPNVGTFILSCHAHCQGGGIDVWIDTGAPLLENTTMSKAVGDWFFDRAPSKRIDCPYPCNPTCHNSVPLVLTS